MIFSTMHSEMRSSGINSVTSPIFFPNLQNLAQQHSSQQRVRNLIRASDTVLVTSESNISGDVFPLSMVLWNVDISLTIIFFTVSPSNCVISSSLSPLHVMTQLASSSMEQATLTALSCSLSFLHFFLKIHRLHLIAFDRCEWPRTSPTSRAMGPRPSCNFVKHVIFGSLCSLWAFFPNDSKLPC